MPPPNHTTIKGPKDRYGWAPDIRIPNLKVESSDEDSGDVCTCSDCWETKPKEDK